MIIINEIILLGRDPPQKNLTVTFLSVLIKWSVCWHIKQWQKTLLCSLLQGERAVPIFRVFLPLRWQ